MANPVGRPPKVTKEQRAEVYQALIDYIARTADPILVGFCAWDPVAIKYWITKDNLNDWEEFSELRKRAVQKSEAYLASGAVQGKLNATMSIFRLKQPVHGYRDHIDSDVTSGGEKIEVGFNAAQAEQLIRARAARESADT